MNVPPHQLLRTVLIDLTKVPIHPEVMKGSRVSRNTSGDSKQVCAPKKQRAAVSETEAGLLTVVTF